MNKQSLVNFELDKTVKKGSFIKRQTSGSTRGNEWQRVTTNGNEWYNKNISLTTFFTVDDFFSFSLIYIPSLISCLLDPSFFRSSHRRCSVTYSSSYNLTPAISRVLIGEHLIFCSPPWPTCCTSPRKCTPVKYKVRQKAGFPIVIYTTSQEKMFLEISQNSQENNCVRVSFLIKLQAKKKETLAQALSCEFCEISKNNFFAEHLWDSASVFCLAFLKLLF